jgi:hypothetical protein
MFREQNREKVMAAKQYLREQGVYQGKAPYGFTKQNHELIPIPFQQAVIAIMTEWKLQGFSYRQIAEELNKRAQHDPQYLSQTGIFWSYRTVYNVLSDYYTLETKKKLNRREYKTRIAPVAYRKSIS